MALNGTAYAVDIERLRRVFGSKDHAFLDELLASQAEYIASVDRTDAPSPEYTLRKALGDIIDGRCRAPKSSRHLYGYAIEALCKHLGEVVPNPEDPDFNEIGDPEDLELETPLLGGELPLPVPAWNDTPYVRFLTAAQVAQESKRLTKLDLAHDEPEIEEGRQILLAQLEWVSKKRGKGYVAVLSG